MLALWGGVGYLKSSHQIKPASSVCELISDAELKHLLELPEGAKTSSESSEKPYPACFYRWKNATYPLSKKIGNREMTIDTPIEVNIVIVDEADEAMYLRSIKAYKDGESEEGVGEMAIWGDGLSQISILEKGKLIHIYVKKSQDAPENRTAAVTIANAIIKKL